MAETEKTTINAQVPEAPHSETDAAEVAHTTERASDILAGIQAASSLKTSGLSKDDSLILKKAAIARYREFGAGDATERILATLSVGLQNAAMTSLEHAANAEMMNVRSDELRNATHAAKVVAELLAALGRHRGRGDQDVQVGQVTVESGGQAVVGNVNSEARRHSKPKETDEPTDDPYRAKE